jgi:hypothetical protein
MSDHDPTPTDVIAEVIHTAAGPGHECDCWPSADALMDSDDPTVHEAMLTNLQARGYLPTTYRETSHVCEWCTPGQPRHPQCPQPTWERRVTKWEPVTP